MSSSAPDRSGSPSPPDCPSSVSRCRTVSRHRPSTLADGIDWRAADVTDPEAADDAAKGASVVYQCLNAPYTSGRNCSRRCSGAFWPRPNTPMRCW